MDTELVKFKGIKMVSGGLDLINNIAIGLSILQEHCHDDVQVTEVGNCLAVWGYHGTFEVSEEDQVRLKALGWHFSETDGWLHGLSG